MAFNQWKETTPADASAAMLDSKTMWKAAGWTIEESSDGTTYNASGDEITHAGSGAGGMANTKAWFRMSNGGVEYTVMRGTIDYQYRIKCSPLATFSGGTPGATQTPTATDEKVLLGAGTEGTPTYETLFPTVGGTYRLKGGADSTSPDFWVGCFPTGGGTQSHAFLHESLDAVEPTDGAPFHTICGNAALSKTNLTAETESGSNVRSLATVAAVTPATWDVIPAHSLEAVGQSVPTGLPVNPITGNDESFPIMYMRRAAIANPGYKGVGSFMKWLGISRTTGDTLTLSTTRDRIVFGDVSLPWQGTVPTV